MNFFENFSICKFIQVHELQDRLTVYSATRSLYASSYY